jgi:hypothetical protein
VPTREPDAVVLMALAILTRLALVQWHRHHTARG